MECRRATGGHRPTCLTSRWRSSQGNTLRQSVLLGGEYLLVPAPEVKQLLGDWYQQAVDVSCPLTTLLDKPETHALFSAPRFANTHYTMAFQATKSENRPEVAVYRRLARDAFAHGVSGWGLPIMFRAADPWSDFAASAGGEDMPDYQDAHPGPRGPVQTR